IEEADREGGGDSRLEPELLRRGSLSPASRESDEHQGYDSDHCGGHHRLQRHLIRVPEGPVGVARGSIFMTRPGAPVEQRRVTNYEFVSITTRHSFTASPPRTKTRTLS